MLFADFWPRLFAGVGLVALIASLGCDALGGDRGQKEKQPPPETAEQAIKRMQREECTKLATQPDTILETSDLRYYDKGIVNDYRQLIGVTVLNKARYCAVRSAEGDVMWLDAQGRRFGSTPFKLSKSIPAGGTEKFTTESGTLTSGTLQGAAVKANISFTKVDVIQPP